MRIIFLDHSSTFHPEGLPESGQPSLAAPQSSRQMCGVGEGRERLSQAPVLS